MMKFNRGDRVSFLNEKGGGIVVEVLSRNTLLIGIEDGFEIPFNVNDVLLANNKLVKQEQEPVEKKEMTAVKKTKNELEKKDIVTHKSTRKVELEKEIDLHIEELIDDTRGMSSGEKLEMQLGHFQRELEKAILNKQTRKIIFIHGVGIGRLKQEIYHLLKSYDGLRYYDASYRKYGFGATEIVIR